MVAAALALVERTGPDGLTMRKLAADLGVTTNTIYWHVGSREELIAAVIERRSREQADAPIEGDTARARIGWLAAQLWRGALEHPNVTALAHQAGAISQLEQPLQLALAAELDAAGVRGAEARDALRAILLCIAGFLVVGLGEIRAEPPDAQLFARTLGAVVASFVPEEPR